MRMETQHGVMKVVKLVVKRGLMNRIIRIQHQQIVKTSGSLPSDSQLSGKNSREMTIRCIFSFFSLLRMSLFWLGVSGVALGLSGLNAYLYLQASKSKRIWVG